MATGACVGCLDSRECWVCLGRGTVELRRGHFSSCTRCAGTGACSVCQPVPPLASLAEPRRRRHRRCTARHERKAAS